jgi:hypothetical protein
MPCFSPWLCLGSICRPSSILLPPLTSEMGTGCKPMLDRNHELRNLRELEAGFGARLKIAYFR